MPFVTMTDCGPAAWGADVRLRLTFEAEFGIYNTSATADDVIWIRLDADDAFTLRTAPNVGIVRTADSGNVPVLRYSQFEQTTGTLGTPAFLSQAAWMLHAICDLSTTTNGKKCLPSFTADHKSEQGWIRYVGCRVARARLDAPPDRPARWQLDLIAQRRFGTITAPTEPTLAQLPEDLIFAQDCVGEVKVGSSTARVEVSALAATWINELKPKYYLARYPLDVIYGGRTTGYRVDGFATAADPDEAAYRAGTIQANNVIKFVQGNKSLLLDWKGRAHLDAYDVSRPLGDAISKSLTVAALIDPSATPSPTMFSYAVDTTP